MSFVRIWVHVVFSTKNRMHWLTKDVRQRTCLHIMQHCKSNRIFLQVVNGYTDHIHCLISLGRTQTIADVCQAIKGESSIWINKNNLVGEVFSWQDDYYAVSVSESQVPAVAAYIKKQEEHHMSHSFVDEMNDFVRKYGWALLQDK